MRIGHGVNVGPSLAMHKPVHLIACRQVYVLGSVQVGQGLQSDLR